MKKAIIIGHTGQDGTYLWRLLEKMKYALVGISSSRIDSTHSKFPKSFSVTSYKDVSTLVDTVHPDEIYYLAAVHHSSSDKKSDDVDLFRRSFDVNVMGLINFLESVKAFSTKSKIFYAASSHIFGNTSSPRQNEETPFNPDCIYGTSKTAGIHACRFYRNHYDVFASVGIFYNHESPLRASKYVSKKIIETAVAIRYKKMQKLEIGNLNAAIDWGYSPDYVSAAHKVLQLKKSDEFIISSGEKHIVKEFVEAAFSHLKMDWRKYVEVNPTLITKRPKKNLFGDNRKLKRMTGWKPTVGFEKMVSIMIDAELEKYDR